RTWILPLPSAFTLSVKCLNGSPKLMWSGRKTPALSVVSSAEVAVEAASAASRTARPRTLLTIAITAPPFDRKGQGRQPIAGAGGARRACPPEDADRSARRLPAWGRRR